MARKRDYAAEYQARQRRSQERYGVTYNQQRRLVEQGRRTGLKPMTIRKALRQVRDVHQVRELISAKAKRVSQYAAGKPVDRFEDNLDFEWEDFDFGDDLLFYH